MEKTKVRYSTIKLDKDTIEELKRLKHILKAKSLGETIMALINIRKELIKQRVCKEFYGVRGTVRAWINVLRKRGIDISEIKLVQVGDNLVLDPEFCS